MKERDWDMKMEKRGFINEGVIYERHVQEGMKISRTEWLYGERKKEVRKRRSGEKREEDKY